MAVPTVLAVDASVGVKLFLPEEGADAAQRLFQTFEQDPGRLALVAPDLFYLECANVLWKAARRGIRTDEQARQDIADLVSLGVPSVSSTALACQALDIALTCGVSVYDGSYVAAAAHTGCALVTADERLARLITPDIARLILLRDVGTALGL